MVKESRSSPVVALARSPTSRRNGAVFKKAPAPALPKPRNILTAFARCTVGKCPNKKQPGTPRCRWHNRWLYKVPADAMCAMFEQKLAVAFGGSDAEGTAAPDAAAAAVTTTTKVDPATSLQTLRAAATKALDASQAELNAALQAEHRKHGVSFAWPDEDFVRRRYATLQVFLTAVARELVQPTSELDISDTFAVAAVIERMYMVGLMNPASPFKKLESTHMACLITFFKVFALNNAPKITSEGVLRFIGYMFNKKDRMVVDLLYAQQTHINSLLEMFHVPVTDVV